MTKDVRYITQLSASDLREIAATVNMSQGVGIKIIKNGDNVEISIDQQALACMIQAFCNQKSVPNDTSIDPRDMSLDIS